MKVKATVICDNYVFGFPGTVAEHGLSIFIETDAGNYLMDTGQGKGVVNNSLVLGVDLKNINGIILSHHHSDHTGGLLPVLEVKEDVNIYSHPDLFKESFKMDKGREVYLGIPYCRGAIESTGGKLIFNRDFCEIQPGIWLTGEVPRVTEFEIGDEALLVKTEEGYAVDPLLDDQSVAIETEKGLFVILGCCHSGIINTLTYITEKLGQTHIHTVIGGTHLGFLGEEQREKSIEALKAFDIERIGVSHCTGLTTAARLAEEFGDRFFYCHVGTVITI